MRYHATRSLIFLMVSIIVAATLVVNAQNTSTSSSGANTKRGMQTAATGRSASEANFAFVIHGGAGTILRSNMTPQTEADYRAKLTEALQAGYNILKNDGTSLDAVEAAIRILEDSPLFNAGKGAVLTSAGTVELDASIMDGRTRMAGAVADVKRIKNPISLARIVMEQSPNVLLVGDGAEAFARERGIELVSPDYFITDRRLKELQRAKEKEKQDQQTTPPKSSRVGSNTLPIDVEGMGTVGAVALDKHGNLAAATSTGGKTNKRVGRIGDSPIIGAGTFADNRTCAVSATGDGEYFIRSIAAYDISALMEYKGMSVADASRAVIEKIGKMGGTGGVIALDSHGNFALPFNSEGMYRGWVGADGKIVVEIYKD